MSDRLDLVDQNQGAIAIEVNKTTDQLYSFKDTTQKPAVWTSKGFEYVKKQVDNRTSDCMNNYWWPPGHPNCRAEGMKLPGPFPDGCIVPFELMPKKNDDVRNKNGPKKITLKKL